MAEGVGGRQLTCPYCLYDAATCKVNPASYQVSGTITSIAGQQIGVSGGFSGQPINYYALGYAIATAPDGTKEVRQLLYSTAVSGSSCQVYLNAPWSKAVVGGAILIYPGCDLQYATCSSKFSNALNFGGFPFVDPRNLALVAINAKQSSGGKKG